MVQPGLIEFLLARIAERERLAKDAADEAPALEWRGSAVYDGVYSIDLGPSTHADSDSYGAGADVRVPREMARHIEANRPAVVLAECEAKRRVIDLLVELGMGSSDLASVRDSLLLEMAQAYSEHDGFRDEWRLT